MHDFTLEEYRAILRSDLHAFVEMCFRELNPQTEYQDNWHIAVMCDALTSCAQGLDKRLIINVPPRSLKSTAVSVALVAWLLGHNPSVHIIVVCYAQDLSDTLARHCRRIIESTWYKELFPHTRLSSQKRAVEEFVTTEQGGRFATSVGGVLTGRGADYIIIDDPLKPGEAISETYRKKCNEWFDNTLISRLNDKQKGCIILVMQRLHLDDLVGHVLAQESWRHLSFPAVAPEDRSYTVNSLEGPRTHTWREGEALQTEREPLDVLEKLRHVLGEYNYASQYLQSPMPLGGALIKQDWICRYDPTTLLRDFEQVIQSWDTASKASELSDYSVCTTWGIKGRQYYLLYVFRKRLDYPALKDAVAAHAKAFRATVVLIEDKSSGTQLIQEMRLAGLSGVTEYLPKGDKLMRMAAQSDLFENGRVFVPNDAHWLSDYIAELISFPVNKFDDQVDSTSQALEWIKSRDFMPGRGIFDYYRLRYEARLAGRPMP